MIFIYLFIGAFFGFLLSNQTPINSKLGSVLGSPFRSSFISFSIGTIFLAIVAIVIEMSGNGFPDVAEIFTTQPLWIWLGGILGVIYLTSNILLFPRLGAVQTLLLPMLGQILMSVAIDTFGFFNMTKVPLTWNKILGVLILLLGAFFIVVIANWAEAKKEEETDVATEKEDGLIFWRVWGILIGALSASQVTINGELGHIMKSPVVASLTSFVIGTILIFFVVLFKEKTFVPKEAKLSAQPKWIFLGGLFGALYVLGSTVLVPTIGAGLTVLIGIFGMMIGTILVTQFGFWHSPQKNVNKFQITGIILMFLGIVLIKVIS
jgi:transporter family-2 protein